MKKTVVALLAALLLTGCAGKNPADPRSYVSRFEAVTEIALSDEGILVNGGGETDCVFTSGDIIYYEAKETYDSGNPYGEGTKEEQHSAEEAAAHTVVNITRPGAYRVSGKLSAGQIRVDLGESAEKDGTAVVELILNDADITCTVAPAILFMNTYECDGSASKKNARAETDTRAAGANLILEGSSTVNGSHVAKIFKDKDGEKKLWKQDGAIYSYMSLNIFGPGSLELYADNEGFGSELHLTVNGGNIRIYSGNDGINTSKDDVSITSIHGGDLTIFAGLGAEGDGIDSNGYLVVNGGHVVAAANPISDSGLDSALGTYIHGGTVIATGSPENQAESSSHQKILNLRFSEMLDPDTRITLTREDGSEVCSYQTADPHAQSFNGMILSHPELKQGEEYQVFADGVEIPAEPSLG